MLQKDLQKKLNILKEIEPRESFVSQGRFLISLQPAAKANKKVSAWPWLIFTGAFASLLLLANVFLDLTIAQPRLSLFFNQNDLRNEFTKMALDLQLPEISYRQNIDDTILLALNEISDSQTNHLNTTLLQQEKGTLENNNNAASQSSGEIDALLEQVLF